ncbi:hypothetical protein RCH06_002610 [Polaromonas sp. CG_9.5]|uniref:hypothetical protein n=1 Tax=Polaromonas sp. CG_9.5 TaxID=3071705 RepID=UPI002E069F46|nr:hypothetical protein [Polaromonas sp. CG_9.5]
MFTSTRPRLSSTLRPSRVNRMGKGVVYLGLAAMMALTSASAQVAALDATGLDASGNAKSEMAACKSGKTQQDRAACLKEVHNANAEKRAGKLGNGADYMANAMKRCEVFKGNDDQAACRARIESQAQIDGSVAGGGVLRESETVVPAK